MSFDEFHYESRSADISCFDFLVPTYIREGLDKLARFEHGQHPLRAFHVLKKNVDAWKEARTHRVAEPEGGDIKHNEHTKKIRTELRASFLVIFVSKRQAPAHILYCCTRVFISRAAARWNESDAGATASPFFGEKIGQEQNTKKHVYGLKGEAIGQSV